MTESFHDDRTEDKVDFIQDLVEANTGLEVREFIEREGWNEDTGLVVNLLEDQLTVSDEDYLEDKLGDLQHLKDQRSDAGYALELVMGWLVEDLIVNILEENHDVSRGSADSEREFLSNPEASSDLEVVVDGETVPLEITQDYTGYWQRKGEFSTLRDGKFENLKEEEALIIGLDIQNDEIFILEADKADKEGKSYNPRINKEASIINMENVEFEDVDDLEEVLAGKL